MLVNKCDVCGHEIESLGTNYRVKGLRVEEEHRYGFDVVWKKKDLCFDCRRNIIRAAKLLKAGLEVNEVFIRKEPTNE